MYTHGTRKEYEAFKKKLIGDNTDGHAHLINMQLPLVKNFNLSAGLVVVAANENDSQPIKLIPALKFYEASLKAIQSLFDLLDDQKIDKTIPDPAEIAICRETVKKIDAMVRTILKAID